MKEMFKILLKVFGVGLNEEYALKQTHTAVDTMELVSCTDVFHKPK